ncbi:hypothetical protein BCV71DRAFT_189557, partial [Rhizopus microsporus]
YHEPIRDLDFRRFLKKHGFQVFLIDEYKFNRCYLTCHNESLRTFRRVPNSRPYQRERYSKKSIILATKSFISLSFSYSLLKKSL